MEWISVEDRLPNQYERVLAYGKNKKLVSNHYFMNSCKYYYGHWIINFEFEGEDIDFEEVTHWMPLPDRPEFDQ